MWHDGGGELIVSRLLYMGRSVLFPTQSWPEIVRSFYTRTCIQLRRN